MNPDCAWNPFWQEMRIEVIDVLQFASFVSSQTFLEKTVFFILNNPEERFSLFSDSPFN
ncbi:hypothetical protein LEP1GSC145_4033 [Leptospira interrogans serovar Djasiman str. LT1649]|uniref:Uncharacterized protein n=1 Tax=Leptospira interrogans serovar Lora str. TE 1992 TaxID=1193028 RepID=M3E592_LEPIR|nr:hypothetical protein LEP1GSC080_4198 [Leptospira interrogans str. FPW2026]EMF42095.1 hypothetical protein LEP1GSC067_1501 [Leptospira interrogans serovar Lora str. TE 1992]EMM91220.1 hypothetical protein LEP1GSC145_4033 [Leptospira interrogans serovar Djasiman str. LT1649]EMN07517.1 hypothetical protein LEP1GSC053_1144 [Leptospira interrogans serovar Muenchen str. Brem 129]